MKKKVFLLFTLLILLGNLSWIMLTPTLFANAADKGETSAPHRGFQAPEFTLETPTGQEIALSDYDGHPVLVFFWASWCSVCKRTMPGLQAVYQDYETNGFEILAINTTYQDTLANAVNIFQSQGFTFEMLLDREGVISEEYLVNALPTAVIIGPDGRVADVVIGAGMSEGYLRAYLGNVLGNQK